MTVTAMPKGTKGTATGSGKGDAEEKQPKKKRKGPPQ